MNWYLLLKMAMLSKVANEYWIDDNGQSIYADGDVGDYNHEGYVISTILGMHDLDPEQVDIENNKADRMELALEFIQDETLQAVEILDEEGVIDELLQNNQLPADFRTHITSTTTPQAPVQQAPVQQAPVQQPLVAPQQPHHGEWQMDLFSGQQTQTPATPQPMPHPVHQPMPQQEDKFDQVMAILYANWQHIPVKALYAFKGLSEDEIKVLNGSMDGRTFAMKNWAWKRVQGNNIESWTLTPKDLDIISNGLGDIGGDFDEEDETKEYNISAISTGKLYAGVSLQDIDAKNIRKIMGEDVAVKGIERKRRRDFTGD